MFMNIELILQFLSSWILAPFEISLKFKITFMVVFLPTILKAFAFWMTDSYLKN